jgi:predicted PurR-regulated permease PerM
MDSYTFQLYSQILKIFWRIFLAVLVILAAIVFFPYVKDVLVMFIIAGLFSVLLSPLVDSLESRGFKRGLAILLVMLLILALLAFSLWLIIPRIIHSVEALIAKLQSNIISDLGQKVEGFFDKHFHNPGLARNVTARLDMLGLRLLGSLEGVLKSVGSFLALIVIIPVVTFFLIKDSRRFKKTLISMVPNRYFELSLNILHKTGNQITKYIQGQAIDALLVGILSIIGLFVINIVFSGSVPYFVLIGSLAGLANVIPYIGPIVGAIPALALAILNNPPQLPLVLLWIVILFIVVQAIDNALISPLVVSKSVNMHPLTVIIVIIIGGKIAGALGMLLAVPFTGVMKVIFSQVSWGVRNYKISSSLKLRDTFSLR